MFATEPNGIFGLKNFSKNRTRRKSNNSYKISVCTRGEDGRRVRVHHLQRVTMRHGVGNTVFLPLPLPARQPGRKAFWKEEMDGNS